MQMH
jgi:hypothetical protein